MFKFTLYPCLLSLLWVSLLATTALAATLQDLEKSLQHLRAGSGFHSPLTKIIHNNLDKEIEFKGEIFFAKGKMRLEMTKPQKTLLVYDGQNAWQEQTDEFDGQSHTVVTKVKARNVKRSSALLGALLGDAKVLQKFKLVSENHGAFSLTPKDKKQSEVRKLIITIVEGKLKGLTYTDDFDNQVQFIFEKPKEENISEKKFKYVPPKGAEVSEI
jgi:chaperone LolA